MPRRGFGLKECSDLHCSVAPLLLTRHAIMIAVHLGVGAVLDEVSRLGARPHLRAMRTSIAGELRPGRDRDSYRTRRRGCNRSDGLASLGLCGHGFVLAVPEPGDCAKDGQDNQVSHAAIPIVRKGGQPCGPQDAPLRRVCMSLQARPVSGPTRKRRPNGAAAFSIPEPR